MKDTIKEHYDELISQLGKINQLLRDLGYGQGELDDDLAGCVDRELTSGKLARARLVDLTKTQSEAQ